MKGSARSNFVLTTTTEETFSPWTFHAIVGVAAAILLSWNVSAAKAQDQSTKALFRSEIAPITQSLYCGLDVDFLSGANEIDIEHVYPKHWMRHTLECGQCSESDTYRQFESDFRNLWPSWSRINRAKGNRAFAELFDRDLWRGGGCQFWSRGDTVPGPISGIDGWIEPANESKGEVARSIIYVHERYGGLLPDGQLELMQDWASQDPISEAECARELAISALQGRWNNWLSDCYR